MNYVSTVVGRMIFEDINLELDYMEIIDLSQDDFKVSPRLRDAFQRKQLVEYNPRVHPNAKKFTRFTKDMKISSVQKSNNPSESLNNDIKFSEINNLKKSLDDISDKMSNLVTRVTVLLSNQLEVNDKLNKNFDKLFSEDRSPKFDNDKFNEFVEKTLSYQNNIQEILNNKLSEKDDKIDELIKKLDMLVEKGVSFNDIPPFNRSNFKGKNAEDNASFFDDNVTFIPNINVDNIKTSIKSEDIQQEGTEDILAKLKAMKSK